MKSVKTEYDNRTVWKNEAGELHRTDGPAVEYTDGSKYWYLNGQLHRTDGPAVIGPGYTAWYLNGELHRTDGPALEYSDGTKAWYLNDQRIEPWLLNTKIGKLLYG